MCSYPIDHPSIHPSSQPILSSVYPYTYNIFETVHTHLPSLYRLPQTGCDIPLKEHNLLGKQVSLDENLRRLRRDSKVCDVDPRQGCKRVSCVDHTAVFVCAEQTLDRPLALSCDNVADFAEEILRDCNFVLWVKGWAQDKEERFRVEVRWDTTKGKCK